MSEPLYERFSDRQKMAKSHKQTQHPCPPPYPMFLSWPCVVHFLNVGQKLSNDKNQDRSNLSQWYIFHGCSVNKKDNDGGGSLVPFGLKLTYR